MLCDQHEHQSGHPRTRPTARQSRNCYLSSDEEGNTNRNVGMNKSTRVKDAQSAHDGLLGERLLNSVQQLRRSFPEDVDIPKTTRAVSNGRKRKPMYRIQSKGADWRAGSNRH
jgi:hypothetical protein